MRPARFEYLSGALATVLMVGGGFMVSSTEYLPPPDRVLDFLNQNIDQIFAGSYLGLLSSVLLIWFAGVLRESLRAYEGGTGRLSNLVFGGGVASTIMLTLAFATRIAAAMRAYSDSGISVQSAVLLNDLWSTLMGNILPFTFAVLVTACAVIAIRTDAFPTWFGRVSALLAVGMITPWNYIFIMFGMVWLLVVSLWLYAKAKPDVAEDRGLGNLGQ